MRHAAGIAASAILVGGAVAGLAKADASTHSDPSFVDHVFASPLVVAAARLVLLCIAIVLIAGAGYVVLSIVARARRAEWLTRAGPFELGAQPLDHSTTQTVEQLERRVEERDMEIRTLRRQLDAGKGAPGDGNGT